MALWWLVLMTQWNAKLTTIKTMQDVWPSKHTLVVLWVPKNVYSSPNPQNSWRWFYLEKGSQTRWSWVWGRDPKSQNKHPYKKRRGYRVRKVMWRERQRLEWCIYKPRAPRIAGNHPKRGERQGTPQEPLKATTTAYTLISDYWSSE